MHSQDNLRLTEVKLSPMIEEIKIEDNDSENELHGDELEASMDNFLLEYFADEN